MSDIPTALTLQDFIDIADKLPPDAGCMIQAGNLANKHMIAALLYFARDNDAAKIARDWIRTNEHKGHHLDDAKREFDEGAE